MIIVILILLGLCFGSFANAFVWRLHEQTKKGNKGDKKLSILKGRSMCPSCKHALAAKDLIPVLSWLELRGKCRYCSKPVSLQYPLVELLTALLFVTSFLIWPGDFTTIGTVLFGLWLVIVVIFMILTVYDLRWMILPNKLVYPFIGITVLGVVLNIIASQSFNPLIQAFWGVVVLFGLFYALFQLSGGKWIGGGDVKLAIGLGLLVGGPLPAILVIFTASLLGVMVTLPFLVTGKKKYSSRIPFGPFLLAATIIVVLVGQAMTNWYLEQFVRI